MEEQHKSTCMSEVEQASQIPHNNGQVTELEHTVMGDKRSLNYSQVSKLNAVLSTQMEIHPHNNFPSLLITPAGLVKTVKSNLIKRGISIEDIRMNGSAASYCICDESDNHPEIHYNDIDVIFGIEGDSDFHVIKDAVMTSLIDFLPEQVSKCNLTSQLMEETYVRKMVLVSNRDVRWSLVSLGDSSSTSTTIELKFVDRIRRKYEFTVDSFQILIDSYFNFNKCTEESPVSMSQLFFPSVYALSVYHDYEEALDHLNNRLIHTEAPEEIRGGGLLKYCSLLANGFKPADADKMSHLEPYMCSRFFIDFSTEEVQYEKIEKYVASRFVQQGMAAQKGVEFLDILYAVVGSCAKCLVESERRKTMGVILYIRNMLTPPAIEFFPPLPFHHIITGFHNQYLQSSPVVTYYHYSSSSSSLRNSPPPPAKQHHYHHVTARNHQQQQHPSYSYQSRSHWKSGSSRATSTVH